MRWKIILPLILIVLLISLAVFFRIKNKSKLPKYIQSEQLPQAKETINVQPLQPITDQNVDSALNNSGKIIQDNLEESDREIKDSAAQTDDDLNNL